MNSYLIAIIALVLCSTFFSGTETAFSSVNKIKMKNLAAEDNKRAAIVLDLTENFDKLITTILVGNTIANIAMTTVATVYGIQTWGARIGPTLATVMVTILVLVLGEISPKIIAREYSEEVALFLAPFVKALIIIMTPLTFIFMGLKVLLKKMVFRNPMIWILAVSAGVLLFSFLVGLLISKLLKKKLPERIVRFGAMFTNFNFSSSPIFFTLNLFPFSFIQRA